MKRDSLKLKLFVHHLTPFYEGGLFAPSFTTALALLDMHYADLDLLTD